ncbi:phosphatidate cytidylyltransferase [Geotalea sp. SG265]|uniref:phosphatidate cytidylyltransferase n=1 Tax=Geotalea sp. SG265 TaxID=2922867 RepID=UPI001FAECBAE
MKRLATAIVLLPLLILLIVKGTPFAFSCFIIVISFLGLMEFYQMALPGRKSDWLVAAATGAVVLFSFLAGDRLIILAAITAFVLAFALHMLFRFDDIRDAARESALLMMGLVYVPLLLGHLILLRNLSFGREWILLMLVIVMCGDSAAYYSGSALGRTRLYPEVSPKKSVEGSIGGILGSIAGAVIFKLAVFPQLTYLHCILAAILLGVLGQLGDLFESLLKRSCGVKDSGTIIPGHGGILDRLDSILFAAPAAFYYAYFIFRP